MGKHWHVGMQCSLKSPCTNMTHIYKEIGDQRLNRDVQTWHISTRRSEIIDLIAMYKHDTSTRRSEIIGLIQGTLIGDAYIGIDRCPPALLYVIHPVMVCISSWRIRVTCRFQWHICIDCGQFFDWGFVNLCKKLSVTIHANCT